MKPLIGALFIQSLMLIAMALALIFISLRPAQAQNPPMQGIFTIPPKVEVTIINNTATPLRRPVRVTQQRPVQGWRNPAYNSNKAKTYNKGIYTVPRLQVETLTID